MFLRNPTENEGYMPSLLLQFNYLEDSTAVELSTGGACLLRCFPHEWCASRTGSTSHSSEKGLWGGWK